MGAVTTSSAVPISVKSSPASVNKAKGRGNNLLNEFDNYPSGSGDDETVGTSAVAADLQLLVADVQVAIADFNSERSSFGTNANWIGAQLQAALYMSISDAALASKLGPSSSVREHLRRIVAHLAISEDLLLYGTVSPATVAQAAAANAQLDVAIGPALAAYGRNSSPMLAPSSLGSIFGEPTLSPLSSQTLFAPIGLNGDVPYELGGANVTVAGKPVQVLYISPSQISFHVGPDVPMGAVEVIVTSQNGYVSRGITTIAPNLTRLFTTTDNDNGVAVALNANNQAPAAFDVITLDNYIADKRTRVTLYATGISGSASNWDPSNDVLIGGLVRTNFGESVTVVARLSDGTEVNLPVEFAGTQGLLPGLDQINVILTSELAGAGSVELTLFIGGQRSNSPRIFVQ